MKKINLILLLLVSVISFTGCKKDKGPDYAKLIVGKNWKITAYTGNGTDDITALFEDCEKDNLAQFLNGGNFSVDEGAVKCNANDPQVHVDGTWSISGDKLKFPQEESEVTILELTDKILKYSFISDSFTYIVTYTAQ